ncbi:MAG: hypothetical protein ACMXYF_00030 [Candidatus Woesearchaeota archaeon]
MKIIKTYVLSEKTLTKDIDKFIRDVKKGVYQYDYRYGQEGLKIIKAYFRMSEQELKKANYKEAIQAYEKLFSFLFQREYDYFNYEDIIGKFTMEKYVGNYFYALIQNKDDVFEKYLEYLKLTDEYYFESAFQSIKVNLSQAKFQSFLQKAEEFLESDQTKKNYHCELAENIVEYYCIKDKDKCTKLKEKFRNFLDND